MGYLPFFNTYVILSQLYLLVFNLPKELHNIKLKRTT